MSQHVARLSQIQARQTNGSSGPVAVRCNRHAPPATRKPVIGNTRPLRHTRRSPKRPFTACVSPRPPEQFERIN